MRDCGRSAPSGKQEYIGLSAGTPGDSKTTQVNLSRKPVLVYVERNIGVLASFLALGGCIMCQVLRIRCELMRSYRASHGERLRRDGQETSIAISLTSRLSWAGASWVEPMREVGRFFLGPRQVMRMGSGPSADIFLGCIGRRLLSKARGGDFQGVLGATSTEQRCLARRCVQHGGFSR